MVRLTRIYTRGGDKGETSLGDGSRVPKHALRVAAYGTVDEANAAIGIARLHVDDRSRRDARPYSERSVRPRRRSVHAGGRQAQHRRTAHFSRPGRAPRTRNRRDERGLRPLDSFILPGGSAAAAYLHLARTVTRRAERLVSELAQAEPVNPEALKYLNRLSDHLFVLGRRVNDNGARDVLWVPGANR